MRMLFITLLGIMLFSCDDDGISNDQRGCISGIPNGSITRVIIGCGTQAQYNSFAYYRVDYQELKWEAINKCEECK